MKAKEESLVVGNCLLLRSDFHTLFDAGYLTIDTDFRLLVSKRLKEEFSNGRHYYEHHGARVPNLPTRTDLLPYRPRSLGGKWPTARLDCLICQPFRTLTSSVVSTTWTLG